MMSINESEELAQANRNSSEIVLSVNGVSKKFCRDLKRSLFYGVQDMTSEVLGLREKNDKLRTKEFWALSNVSFQLHRGEAVGLLGKNGSGKSTLLRIIAGLIKPDTGFVEVNGRVAPLIALGAGFNPILTGRENIYANMSILGLSKKEIDERFDEVVEFAEIGDAIDSPVQSYSSGMAARLGFASAVHTQPDILLIDEVLAVGDARFKAKCERRLHKLRESGVAFVLVSHNPQAILSVCPSAVYLQKGKIITAGDVETVMNKYEEDLFMDGTKKSSGAMYRPHRTEVESPGLDIISLFFRNSEGEILDSLVSGETAQLCIGCKAHRKIDQVNFRISISEVGGDRDLLYFGGANDQQFFEISPGEHEIQIHMPHLILGMGNYIMYLFVKQGSLYTFDAVDSFTFSVRSNGKMIKSKLYQPRSWKLVSSKTIQANNE
jgi:lipopolysaccharide transport system ATP-binding protein